MNASITIRAAVNEVARRLSAAGVVEPRLEARLLISHVLGSGIETLYGHPERPLPPEAQNFLATLVQRRMRREPLAYILGGREFWSLPLRVTRDTLVPRPETETLVEAALAWLGDRGAGVRILDLGTGSGCLLLALLTEWPRSWGLGVDRSAPALAVAKANAEALGLADRAHFVVSDWAAAISGTFDVVVSNPPYVMDSELATLAPEVACFEPCLALSGGADGLAAYHAIVPELGRLLALGGVAFLEVGFGTASDVSDMLRQASLQGIGTKSDLAGIERCVWGVAVAD